ncbi:MAG: methyltransferase, TIGR04325 family [Thermoanaerobaculia bacterium]
MSVREVLQRVVRRLDRALERSEAAIWTGIYERYEDVPVEGQGFTDPSWRETLASELRAVRGGRWYEEFAAEHDVLMLLCRLSSSNPLHIVDFGGGFGASFFFLQQGLSGRAIRYQVIETAEVSAAGTEETTHPALTFATSVGPEHRGADVIFVKSALQYLPDYKATLTSLLRLDASHVVLEKFAGVESRTYATSQVNHSGSRIAFWFISLQEVLEMAKASGYRCILRRKLMRTYAQEGFPEHMRMRQATTLVFERDTSRR